MKVQQKGGHEQYEVIEQSEQYYIARANYGQCVTALPKDEYEPVVEWVDETGEHTGAEAHTALLKLGYRLTRHTVNDLKDSYKAYAYLLERMK